MSVSKPLDLDAIKADCSDETLSGPFLDKAEMLERFQVLELVAEVERQRGLIKQVEWAYYDDGAEACPFCRAWRFDGGAHTDECPAFSRR